MTFNDQIANMPMELVKHGWRLKSCCNEPLMRGWDRCGTLDIWHDWQHVTITSDGLRLVIVRPVSIVRTHLMMESAYSSTTARYAHAGWGEGLAPTPEMVKVWKWWWYLPAMGTFLRAVEVLETPESLKLQCADIPAKPITQARGEWRGPVLPPVEVA